MSIDACRGPAISPLRIKIRLSFSQADLGTTCAQILLFSFLFKFGTFFLKICAHSERYRKLWRVYFEIQTFFWQHRVSIVTGVMHHNVFFLFGKKIRRTRPQPALQVGRPKVPMWTVSLIHSARVYQVSDTTTVRPALLMGGQGGSAVDIIVVAPGTSTSSSVEPKGNSS